MTSPCSVALLELALAEKMSAEQEESLHRHLEECQACAAALEQMAGGAAWCREAAALLMGDDLDDEKGDSPHLCEAPSGPFRQMGTVPFFPPSRAGGDEWSDVDFTVEHLEPSDEPNVLGRLGGYDVLEIIGRGGMGVVLKGFDRELKRCVAIKILSPHLAQSSLAKKRFIREAQAAAAVVHPNVLAIHQVQPSGRLPFLVMPLVAGESLAQRLTAQGRLELKETLRIGMQAAAGLAAAHEQGLVHRDVKPANILLEKGVERAVLTDFGLARAADDVSMTRWGVIAGTPQYMSPEQARGEPLDGRSDLFSLGCVLYEMATGVSPFRADSTMATLRRLIDDPPPAMASFNPELPPWFIGIVECLLEKDPSRRFGSAKEVSELLEGCLAHLQQPAGVPLPNVSGVSGTRRVPPAESSTRDVPPEESGTRRVPDTIPATLRKTLLKGTIAMLATLGIALLGVFLVQSTAPPDIAGRWSGEDWGQVVLDQTARGEYAGTYSDTVGKEPGKIQLKWSRIERRFNGRWSEGGDRFGDLSIRLADGEIRGALTTDPKSKINPATPRLADLTWNRPGSSSGADLTKSSRTWDLERQFSAKTNPAGAWSYGYTPDLDSGYKLTLYDRREPTPDMPLLDRWGFEGGPVVSHNPTDMTLVSTADTASTCQPHTVYFHPGVSYFCVIRWTAPQPGSYTLRTTMANTLPGSDGVDIWVIKNTSETLFKQYIYRKSQDFSKADLTLARGDTIDFVVGRHGDTAYDTTSISAQIEAVPPVSGSHPAVPEQTEGGATKAPGTVDFSLESDGLSHRVSFEVGETYLRDGDRITIDEIRGTADTIKEGNVYEIKGTYRLASRDKAMLAAYTTVGSADPTAQRFRDVPDLKTQSMSIERGEGRFTLIFYMWQNGCPHVSFYSDKESFASVYFGTGDSVLHKPMAQEHDPQIASGALSKFAQLSEREQKAALLDGIQRIQRKCANISLRTTSQVSKVDVDPVTKTPTTVWEDFGRCVFDLRRIEGSYRFAMDRYRPGKREPVERCVYHHNAESGVDRRVVTERSADGSDQNRAWISRDSRGGPGSECRYASYLGGLDFVGFPENDFFKFLLDHQADLRIRGIDQESRLVEAGFAYTAEEGRKTGSCTVWLDLGKDFMLRRRVWAAKYRAKEGEHETYERFEVDESDQFDGLWLPTRFTDVTSESIGRRTMGNRWDTTAENVKVGSVKKEDLEVVFPAGTLVHNEITGDRWIVGKSAERLPYRPNAPQPEKVESAPGPGVTVPVLEKPKPAASPKAEEPKAGESQTPTKTPKKSPIAAVAPEAAPGASEAPEAESGKPAPAMISLAQAVRGFNLRAKFDPVGKDQPPLSEDEVIAAVRWSLQEWSRQKKDTLPVSDETLTALQEIADARRLPQEFKLERITRFIPNDQMEFTRWSVRLRVPAAEPRYTTCISIRERMIGSRLLSEEERKEMQSGVMHYSHRAGDNSNPPGTPPKQTTVAKATAGKPTPGMTSLADAISAFNVRAASDPVGKDQPPLSEDEVIGAIRWSRATKENPPPPEQTQQVLQSIVDSHGLPQGFELEAITNVQPNDRTAFTKWSVRLRIPAEAGGTAYVSIRETVIGSRLLGEAKQQARHAAAASESSSATPPPTSAKSLDESQAPPNPATIPATSNTTPEK